MKIMESQIGQLFYGNKEYASFSEGSSNLYKDKAIPMAQKIHDMLIGQGLTYMQCWLILHLVENTLKEERDTQSL